ncbi:MAG: hypothetical protein QM703_28665 [Gemmatales bacterium]
MRYFLLFSVLVVGCGGNESKKTSESSGKLSAIGADDKEEKYKASVIAFIEEAKSILKSMDQSVDKAAYDKRCKALEVQLTRMPAPSSGFAPRESWTKSNKAILANLNRAGTLSSESDRNQLGELKSALSVLLDHYETKVRSSQSYVLPTLTK